MNIRIQNRQNAYCSNKPHTIFDVFEASYDSFNREFFVHAGQFAVPGHDATTVECEAFYYQQQDIIDA